MVISETIRLVIREFTADDTGFIVELVNTPSWMQYIGDRNIKNTVDALNYLERGPLKSYREYGFGLNCVILKEENIPIGMCGLIKRDTLEDVDIGFAFLPRYEGKGYASESSLAMLQHAKELNMKRIVAITLPENEKSVRLLGRINMIFEKMVHFPNEEKELMLYSIDLSKMK